MIIANEPPNIQHQLHFGGSSTGDSTGAIKRKEVINSFFSSLFVDNYIYIIDRTRPPTWISEFLRIVLLAQIFLAGFVPSAREFWEKSKLINRIMEFFFMLFLIRPPKYESDYFIIYFSLFSIIYVFFALVTLIMRITFIYTRSFPYKLAVFASYYLPITELLFYSPICSCCGIYIGNEYAKQVRGPGWFMVVLIFLLIVNLRIRYFISTEHFQYTLVNPYFKTVSSNYCTMMYFSLGMSLFLAYSSQNIMTSALANSIFFVICAFFEVIDHRWTKAYDSIDSISVYLSSIVSSLVIWGFSKKEPEVILFLNLSVFFIVYFVIYIIINKIHERVLFSLQDPDYAAKISSSRKVSSDLYIGLTYANKNVLNNIFSVELLRRFPNDISLNMLIAYTSMFINSSPIPIEALAQNIRPLIVNTQQGKYFQHELGPIAPQSIEKYNKHVLDIHKRFYKLIQSMQMVLRIINDELTLKLPFYALVFEKEYKRTVRALLQFFQEYPNSPSGLFFLHFFDLLFPYSPELPELKFWCTYRYDHIDEALTLYPKLANIFALQPSIFNSNNYNYTMTTNPGDDEKLEKELHDRPKKHPNFRNPRGPFASAMCCWGVVLLIILLFGVTFGFFTFLFISNLESKKICSDITLTYEVLSNITLIPTLVSYLNIHNVTAEKDIQFYLNMLERISQDVYFAQTGISSEHEFKSSFVGKSNQFISQLLNRTVYNIVNISYAYMMFITINIAEELATKDLITLSHVDISDRTDYSNLVLLKQIVLDFKNFLDHQSVNMSFGVNFQVSLVVFTIVWFFSMCALLYAFILGKSYYEYFIMSLRNLSKSTIASFLDQLKKYELYLSRSEMMIPGRKLSMFFLLPTFIVPFTIFFVVLEVLVVVFLLSYSQFSSQIYHQHQVGSTVTDAFVNISDAAYIYIDTLINPNISLYQLSVRYQQHIYYQNSFIHNNWNENYKVLNSKGFVTGVLNWYTMIGNKFKMKLDTSIKTDLADDLESIEFFFKNIVSYMIEYRNEVMKIETEQNSSSLSKTISCYVLFILVCIIFICFYIRLVYVLDRPFNALVRLLNILPSQAFPTEVIETMTKGNWKPREILPDFSNSFYDLVLETIPESVVTVDMSLSIVVVNHAARDLFECPSDLNGRKFFEVLKYDFVEAGTNVPLRSLIDRYLYSDITLIISHKIVTADKKCCEFTILPLLNEESFVKLQNRNATRMAFIFKDVTTIEEQKRLLREEEAKPMKLLMKILPPPVVTPLLDHQRPFSFEVSETAIAMIRVDPSNLNLFNIFEKMLESYNILCHVLNDDFCYVVASGFFLQGMEGRVHVYEILNFCYEVISKMPNVKIGCSYGGPMFGGMLGYHNPIFEVCGHVYENARQIELETLVGELRIDQSMKDIVLNESLPFKLEEASSDSFIIKGRTSIVE